MKNRYILHCDLNGFFASVECALAPQLKNVPMAVGGNEKSRHGIILAKNELAKKYGVQTAETLASARKKCPELVIVPPHYDKYEKYSKYVNTIYLRYTDLVEPFGIDESWLDITGTLHLYGDVNFITAKKIADEIRETIKRETGLTASVGVSFNKAFAKLGSDYKKPDATTVITRENYKQIVYPLNVNTLLFVGRSVSEKLNQMHISTIGQLAEFPLDILEKRLGAAGDILYKYANGEDDDPVGCYYSSHKVKSVGRGITFSHDIADIQSVQAGLSALASDVCARMRHQGIKCKTVQLSVKDVNFKTVQRRLPLEQATNSTKKIYSCALDIFNKCWSLKKPIRAMTVTALNLVYETEYQEQISFFEISVDDEKEHRLDSAVDKITDKFGKDAIKPASLINNDMGIK